MFKAMPKLTLTISKADCICNVLDSLSAVCAARNNRISPLRASWIVLAEMAGCSWNVARDIFGKWPSISELGSALIDAGTWMAEQGLAAGVGDWHTACSTIPCNCKPGR